jgi:hypothetical protein
MCDTMEYWPYPSKVTMLLDLIDNLGRSRFSSSQLKLIMLFAKELGVPNVPSYEQFRKLQASLQKFAGSKPHQYTSVSGNKFYMNDVRDIVARVSTFPWDLTSRT